MFINAYLIGMNLTVRSYFRELAVMLYKLRYLNYIAGRRIDQIQNIMSLINMVLYDKLSGLILRIMY
jgi:hypothetical protein